jgi:hypothetical protein
MEDLATLDSARSREVQLSIEAWVTKFVRQGEKNLLGNTTGIMAEGPAHIESHVRGILVPHDGLLHHYQLPSQLFL